MSHLSLKSKDKNDNFLFSCGEKTLLKCDQWKYKNSYSTVHTATLTAGKLHYFPLSAEMPDRLLPTMHILQAALFSSEQCPLEWIFIENKTNLWISIFQVTERLQIFLGNQFCQLLTCLVPNFSLDSCLIYKNIVSPLFPAPSTDVLPILLTFRAPLAPNFL